MLSLVSEADYREPARRFDCAVARFGFALTVFSRLETESLCDGTIPPNFIASNFSLFICCMSFLRASQKKSSMPSSPCTIVTVSMVGMIVVHSVESLHLTKPIPSWMKDSWRHYEKTPTVINGWVADELTVVPASDPLNPSMELLNGPWGKTLLVPSSRSLDIAEQSPEPREGVVVCGEHKARTGSFTLVPIEGNFIYVVLFDRMRHRVFSGMFRQDKGEGDSVQIAVNDHYPLLSFR